MFKFDILYLVTYLKILLFNFLVILFYARPRKLLALTTIVIT